MGKLLRTELISVKWPPAAENTLGFSFPTAEMFFESLLHFQPIVIRQPPKVNRNP